MINHNPRHATALKLPMTGGLAGLFTMICVNAADAHVKWFCAFDVAGQPRGLENVLCMDFELLTGIALSMLLAGCFFEQTPFGAHSSSAHSTRVTHPLMLNTETLIRGICGFFFVSLWAIGGIMLTPELKTTSTYIPLLQLAIAAGMLSRKTLPLSAAGIVTCFILAVRDYGIFHLADYPIFLGLAAYLTLTGLQKNPFGFRPLDIFRYATAITLMWASIEKWAYPEWSFPLFIEHAQITLGFDNETFMRAAGVVEFVLAFSLLWTPLVRRCAAIILAAMFVSACFEFGKLDVIGHSAIIAVLFAIVADDAKVAEQDQRTPLFAAPAFGGALVATLVVYYMGHAAIFGTAVL